MLQFPESRAAARMPPSPGRGEAAQGGKAAWTPGRQGWWEMIAPPIDPTHLRREEMRDRDSRTLVPGLMEAGEGAALLLREGPQAAGSLGPRRSVCFLQPNRGRWQSQK